MFTKVPPYIINMPKLFELYVWSKLKERYKRIYYQYNARGDIPDFLVEDKSLIVDAKYKYIDGNNPDSEDIGQLSRYGRNRIIRDIVLGKRYVENLEPRLIIVYPTFDRSVICSKIKSYYKIYKVAVPIPLCDG